MGAYGGAPVAHAPKCSLRRTRLLGLGSLPVTALFRKAGGLREAYAAVDWTTTSLGDPDSWSPTLRAMTDLALNTEFAVTLLWGPDFTMIYNEAYVPIIGDKHPAALGAPAREVFPEIWGEIGPMMQGVRDGNGPVWMPDIRLLMNRHGFAEECFFNFCYSPVGEQDGAIEGVVDIVTETTDRVLAQRRLELLARLGQTLTAELARPQDVTDLALPLLRADDLDLRAVDIRWPGAVTGTDEAGLLPPTTPLVPDGLALTPGSAGPVAWLEIGATGDGPNQPVLAVALSENLVFDENYRAFLRLVADSLRQAFDRITALDAERQIAAAERGLSEALQRSLLSTPLQPDHLHIAVRYHAAIEQVRVGGDWYDSFLLPDGALTVTVGDVSGHDRRAVVAMAQIRNLLRGLAYASELSPAAALADLDRAMQGLKVGSLATAIVARVEQTPSDAERGLRTLRWSNAGHPPPVLISPDGAATLMETEVDLMLGVTPGAARADHTVTLEPGSSVVFYTDGLVERRDEDMAASLEGLAGYLDGRRHDTAEQVCDALLDHYGASAEDDIVLLVLHAYDQAEPRPPSAGPNRLHSVTPPAETRGPGSSS